MRIGSHGVAIFPTVHDAPAVARALAAALSGCQSEELQAGTPALGAANLEFRRSGDDYSLCNTPLYFLMIHKQNIDFSQSPVIMGKYRIAACPRPLPCGRFAAQVSIASGRGSASTDRVMRFVDEFPTLDDAARYAIAQGIDWVSATTKHH
jgi:hypothetical protein